MIGFHWESVSRTGRLPPRHYRHRVLSQGLNILSSRTKRAPLNPVGYPDRINGHPKAVAADGPVMLTEFGQASIARSFSVMIATVASDGRLLPRLTSRPLTRLRNMPAWARGL